MKVCFWEDIPWNSVPWNMCCYPTSRDRKGEHLLWMVLIIVGCCTGFAQEISRSQYIHIQVALSSFNGAEITLVDVALRPKFSVLLILLRTLLSLWHLNSFCRRTPKFSFLNFSKWHTCLVTFSLLSAPINYTLPYVELCRMWTLANVVIFSWTSIKLYLTMESGFYF